MESQTKSGRSSNWIKLKLKLKRWIFFQKKWGKGFNKGELMRERKRERERERSSVNCQSVSQFHTSAKGLNNILVLYCRRQA